MGQILLVLLGGDAGKKKKKRHLFKANNLKEPKENPF